MKGLGLWVSNHSQAEEKILTAPFPLHSYLDYPTWKKKKIKFVKPPKEWRIFVSTFIEKNITQKNAQNPTQHYSSLATVLKKDLSQLPNFSRTVKKSSPWPPLGYSTPPNPWIPLTIIEDLTLPKRKSNVTLSCVLTRWPTWLENWQNKWKLRDLRG